MRGQIRRSAPLWSRYHDESQSSSAAAGRSRGDVRTPRPRPCAGPARRRAAQRFTRRWSHAPIKAKRRHVPTRSSRRAFPAWCPRWRTPMSGWPDAGTRCCAQPGSAVDIGIGGAEARRAHAGHIRRTCRTSAARHAETRGVFRRQGGACGAKTGSNYRNCRAGQGASAARDERCHSGRHRHRAGGRSATDLPASRNGGAVSGAGGA